jgi:hypothetical protein
MKMKVARYIALLITRPKTTAWQAKQMQRFYYVYILTSKADSSIHYTGVSDDLSARSQQRPMPTYRQIQTMAN